MTGEALFLCLRFPRRLPQKEVFRSGGVPPFLDGGSTDQEEAFRRSYKAPEGPPEYFLFSVVGWGCLTAF